QLTRIGAFKRQRSRQQLLVDDGEAVLIAVPAHVALEHFRRAVERGHAQMQWAGLSGVQSLQALHQTEISQLDMVADDKEIARFDVQVLQAILLVQQIERFGGIGEEGEKFISWYARLSLRLALMQTILQ